MIKTLVKCSPIKDEYHI